MVSVALCPADQIDRIWPIVMPMLLDAIKLSNGRHSDEDLYWMISSSKAQLWAIANGPEIVAGCISCVQPYPGREMLNVLFVGGHGMKDWLGALIDKLKRFAVHNRLEGIEMVGRPGWLRVLDKFEFKKQDAVLMELALDGK